MKFTSLFCWNSKLGFLHDGSGSFAGKLADMDTIQWWIIWHFHRRYLWYKIFLSQLMQMTHELKPGMWIRKFDFGSTKTIDFGFRQNFKSLIWEKLSLDKNLNFQVKTQNKTRYLPTSWTVADCTTTPRRLCHLVPTFFLYYYYILVLFITSFVRSIGLSREFVRQN